MKSNRRQFLRGAGASLVAASIPRVIAEDLPTPPDITQLLLAQGFDASAPGNCLMAIIGDTHIFLDTTDSRYTDKLDDGLVNELNGLTPAPSDLVFAGDLIISHSVAVGLARHPVLYERARSEMRIAKAQFQRFRPELSLWKIPGNHDTDKDEIVPTLWQEEIGTPPYQRLERAGMPVLLLNTGHSGGLDPVQISWFLQQAAGIPTDQEVLIIAHHPSFFYIAAEAGFKRVAAAAFAGHQAPVWIVGGHGHSFAERLYVDKGTRFVQMEVTCGSTKFFGDGNNPGYILLGLKDGKVACRIFRSVKKASFDVRPALPDMTPVQVDWPFGKIDYPAELFEESFYDRSNRLVAFTATDLRFGFVYTQSITFRIEPARFSGRLSEFLLLGRVGAAARPTALCSFSSAGLAGPWVSVPMPLDVLQVYRIPIPEELRNVAVLHIKLSTALPSNQSDITVGGWGTAASAQSLSGYEKWISTRYRTFLNTSATNPEAVAAGYTLPNIVRFAFNLPDLPAVPPSLPGVISGLPAYSTKSWKVADFRYSRRRASVSPDLIYWTEERERSGAWVPVAAERLWIKPLDEVWEEVAVRKVPGGEHSCLFRVRLQTPSGGTVVGPPAGDSNGNSIDDLVEYAFALNPSEPVRYYDPARPDRTGGMPVFSMVNADLRRLVFPRIKAGSNPGISYIIQQSADLDVWTDIPPSTMGETILRSSGDWEEVEVVVLNAESLRTYYRVKVTLSTPLVN